MDSEGQPRRERLLSFQVPAGAHPHFDGTERPAGTTAQPARQPHNSKGLYTYSMGLMSSLMSGCLPPGPSCRIVRAVPGPGNREGPIPLL